MNTFNVDSVKELRSELNGHKIYGMIQNISDLRVFMNHHVFSVWDFMSLLKALQREIAPSSTPWAARSSKSSRRFINTIVLEEESDISLPDKDGNETYSSHFEMYCDAMKEVGANYANALNFSNRVLNKGYNKALEITSIPEPSKKFMNTTMSFINSGKAHIVGAAFALGRETVIPGMFREILERMQISREDAPHFYYYLERHIHLDEDFHAPLAMKVLDEFCDGDSKKIAEAENFAREAIQARILFWDGVAKAIEMNNLVLTS